MYYWFLSMLTDCFLCLLGIAVHLSNAHLISLKVHDTHNVIFLKFTFNVSNSDGEDADSLFRV